MALSLSVDGVTNGAVPEDSSVKAPRLPRWTRQEILVLIRGKREAENRVRRGGGGGGRISSNASSSSLGFGSGQSVEPKWASVSSYCKRHGVNRGPVQCRKRWSNLAGDYKKIKEWEGSIKEETESFWVMRNDLRRERKLPGFFDREVYDILEDRVSVVGSVSSGLALALGPVGKEEEEEEEKVAEEEEQAVVFDSGRSAAAEEGLFSEEEGSPLKEIARKDIPAPVPISEQKTHQPYLQVTSTRGTTTEKQPTPYPEGGSTSQEGRKRKRFTLDAEVGTNLQDQLIEVMEKNGRMLNLQLEAQNTNFKLDREQRKDHAESLVGVLNKLADALVKIADKL